ncbi:MAG: class I SAM-dependent methyltransferase [Alkalispirochaetaceae bacterium]
MSESSQQAEFFYNRLKKRKRHLWKWADRNGITAFRLYHRDIPELPFAVDWYDGYVHISEFRRPHDRTPEEHATWLDEMMVIAARALGVAEDRVFLKVRERQKGRSQYEKQGREGFWLEVAEHGLIFLVNLTDYIDTGLFLDHRELRRQVAGWAKGGRVLNLFSYTGTFTCYAAVGGARSSVSVDLSNTYTDWARQNLERNGFVGREHELITEDVLAYLENAVAKGRLFDLIILDPPTFSNSKKMAWNLDIQRDHPKLIRLCSKLLDKRGTLLFSTNRKGFRLLRDKLPLREIKDITKMTMPRDFEGTGIHKAWTMRR